MRSRQHNTRSREHDYHAAGSFLSLRTAHASSTQQTWVLEIVETLRLAFYTGLVTFGIGKAAGERRSKFSSALDFHVGSAMKKLQIISEDVQGLVKADKFTGHCKK